MSAPRLFALAGLAAGLVFVAAGPAADKDADAAKKALQEVGDFVGEWKGSGEAKAGGAKIWKETVTWGWKFKDGESWIALDAKDGRNLTGGDLKYDTAKKVYRLTATTKDGKEQSYEGKLDKGKLVLSRKESGTGDVTRLTLFTLSDGARMTIQSEVQAKGKGLYATQYKVTATKEGESFAGGGKKPECVVTGGLGTMTVSYNGKTYYVCCSGCRDEFNADPKKYVDAFEKNKK